MICIPIICDRIVQRAIVSYLVSKKKFPIYNSSSFGFIKDRGTKLAIEKVIELRASYDWCLKTDIEAFFDRIPRGYLKECVKKALGTHSLTPIIYKVIDCEIRQVAAQRQKLQKQGIKLGVGVRQGMPLSPLLANLVLSDFDREIERASIIMVRYADDITLFFRTKHESKLGHDIVKALLKKIDLNIPEMSDSSKTQLIGPREPLDFLGREIVYLDTKSKFVARVSKRQIEKISKQLEEDFCFTTRSKEGSNFLETVADLWRSVSAYLGVYKDADNFTALDAAVRTAARKIITNIFLELFGEDALSGLTPEGRNFLGIGLLNVSEPLNDLEL